MQFSHPLSRIDLGGRRRWASLVFAFVLAVGISLFNIPGARAVHDLDVLELDADIENDTDPQFNNVPPPDTVEINGTDWGPGPGGGGVFATHTGADCPGEISNPGTEPAAGQIDATFVCDFEPGANGPDPSYHEPSNQDPQAIDPTGGSGVWGCGSVANPTDKDDIVNAYAIAVESDGDLVMYWGTERYDNSGTAFIGIWFFQADVACDQATGKFTGQKTNGDILVVSDYTNGGVINTLSAFRWSPGPTSSSPGTFTLVASGIDCDDTLGGDDLCANVNLSNVVTPWPMEDKQKPGPPNPDPVNTLEISEFFEGGINLTNVFEDAGLTPPECFGSFMAETRSAAQLESATLKDFALGDLQTCFPDVHVAKTSSVSSIGAGGSYNYTITVTNDGNFDALDVVVTDDLDDSLIVNSVTPSQGTCDPVGAGNTISCNLGDLAPGANATVTINVTTTSDSCPSVANTSHVTAANERVEDQGDNASDPVTVNVQCGAIAVDKTTTKGDPLGGVKFTISGPSGTFEVTTDEFGQACVGDLAFGSYTVTETVPAGYSGDPGGPQTFNIQTAGSCPSTPTVTAHFTNTPLSEIEVQFRSLAGPGVTVASIVCESGGTTVDPVSENGSPDPERDDSDEVFTDLAPGVYTCTVDIDP